MTEVISDIILHVIFNCKHIWGTANILSSDSEGKNNIISVIYQLIKWQIALKGKVPVTEKIFALCNQRKIPSKVKSAIFPLIKGVMHIYRSYKVFALKIRENFIYRAELSEY